jgi:hypothetical protein
MKLFFARATISGGLCLTWLAGCGSAQSRECSRIAVFDYVNGGQLWSKDEATNGLRAAITGDGELIGLERSHARSHRVQLISARSGEILAEPDGVLGQAGPAAVNVGPLLYGSVDAGQLPAHVDRPLRAGGWVGTAHLGDGIVTPPTFKVFGPTGQTLSLELPGEPVDADASGAISVWNGAMTEYDPKTGLPRWTVSSELFQQIPETTMSDRYVEFQAEGEEESTWVIDRSTGKMRKLAGRIVDLEGDHAVIQESQTLRRVDLSTDTVLWNEAVDLEFFRRIGGILVGIGGVSRPLVAIRVDDGTVAWRRAESSRRTKLRGTLDGGLLLSTPQSPGTTLERIDVATGLTTWTEAVPIELDQLLVGGTLAVVTGRCGK